MSGITHAPCIAHDDSTLEKRFVAYVTLCLRRHASRWKRAMNTHCMRESLTLNDVVVDGEGHKCERINLQVADADSTEENVFAAVNPDQTFDRKLFKAFRTLTQRQQQTLVLLLLRQMRQQDAARCLGVSQQVVCRSKSRALDRLRACMTGRR